MTDSQCSYDLGNQCSRQGQGEFCSQHAAIVESLLREVKDENVSWRRPGSKKTTFRLWTNDTDYKVVSRQMAFLVHHGLVTCHMAAGYTFVSRGYCDLTNAGRVALKNFQAEVKAT